MATIKLDDKVVSNLTVQSLRSDAEGLIDNIRTTIGDLVTKEASYLWEDLIQQVKDLIAINQVLHYHGQSSVKPVLLKREDE